MQPPCPNRAARRAKLAPCTRRSGASSGSASSPASPTRCGASCPRAPETGTHWEPQPFPFPPQPAIGVDVDDSPWVEAAEAGACPAHHPVKAKLTSGIFHVPGGANYARTVADRCYLSPEAAEADGLRASKN